MTCGELLFLCVRHRVAGCDGGRYEDRGISVGPVVRGSRLSERNRMKCLKDGSAAMSCSHMPGCTKSRV